MQRPADRTGDDLNAQLITQFRQREVGLPADKLLEAMEVFVGELGGLTVTSRQRSDRPKFPAALLEPTDPSRTHAEQLSHILGPMPRITAGQDPFA